jgi:hypothetical protein
MPIRPNQTQGFSFHAESPVKSPIWIAQEIVRKRVGRDVTSQDCVGPKRRRGCRDHPMKCFFRLPGSGIAQQEQ